MDKILNILVEKGLFMKRLLLVASIGLSLFFGGCKSINTGDVLNTLSGLVSSSNGELTDDMISKGLKEALEKGTQKAVATLAKSGGYGKNKFLRIRLPKELDEFAEKLRYIGVGSSIQNLENKMNEAAEMAAKEAGPVFVSAITKMTLTDVKTILNGGPTAATEYFLKATHTELRKRYKPIVRKQMDQIGFVARFNQLVDHYHKIPLVKKINFSTEDYVTGKALDGMFYMLAQTEKSIRENPAARTTELLKRVFGSLDK